MSCLVYIRHRHPKAPVALVGKGITFDTGGVDLKPASAMRHEKRYEPVCLVGLTYPCQNESKAKLTRRLPLVKILYRAWLDLAMSSILMVERKTQHGC